MFIEAVIRIHTSMVVICLCSLNYQTEDSGSIKWLISTKKTWPIFGYSFYIDEDNKVFATCQNYDNMGNCI